MSVVTWQKSRDTCSHGAPPITGLHVIFIVWNRGSTYLSNSALRTAASALGRVSSHDATSGRHPSSVSET